MQRNATKSEPVRQFSLASLLGFMVFTAVVFGLGALARHTQRFQAFGTFGALLTWLTLTGLWGLDVARVVRPRTMVDASMGLLLVSLLLPAISLERGSMMFESSMYGLTAVWGTILGTIFLFYEPRMVYFACVCGLAANVLFVLAYAESRINWHRGFGFALAMASAVSVVLSLFTLAACGQLAALYPGYAVWLGSSLALARGNWLLRPASARPSPTTQY